MFGEPVYLKQNVLVEPLINQWYAWSYLVAPATAAMYIANAHLRIMQSFVANPQVHIAALKNPAMVGGPFINYDAGKVPEIRSLIEKTTKEQSHMLEFAEAVRLLAATLSEEATGYSMEPLYQKVPDALRGYVELVYDLNNNPTMRFIEGLLYKSKYVQESSQSIEISLALKDVRSFIFSTPRLRDEARLYLNVPFSFDGLDDFFRMKTIPSKYESIKDRMNVEDKDNELFSTFFTLDKHLQAAAYEGDGVRIRYLGHACLLIESQGVCILSDPVISYQENNGTPRYTYADLPETIDYVVLTHNHQDHVMFETLLQLRHKVKTVIVPRSCGGLLADPSLKLVLQHIGFDNVVEIEELESIAIKEGTITGIPFFGEHADLFVRAKTAYLIKLKGKTILCAADSNNIEPRLYEHIHDSIGSLDVAFIGMECDGAPLSWLYGPLLSKPLPRKMDQSRRLDGSDYAKAIDMVDRLKPRQVYVYAMGQEPWLTYLTSIHYTDESRPIIESNKLVNDCLNRGLLSERLFCQKEIFL